MGINQNVITIEPAPGNETAGRTMFQAPADSRAAHQLWVFLIENLRPGFCVKLSSGQSALDAMTGGKLPPAQYREVME